MPATLMTHDRILQEVLEGTGAAFAVEASRPLTQSAESHEGASVFAKSSHTYHKAANFHVTWPMASLFAIALGVTLAALISLAVAFESFTKSSRNEELIESIGTNFNGLSNVKQIVNEIQAEQTREREDIQNQTKMFKSAEQEGKEADLAIRGSIAQMDAKIDRSLNEVAERDRGVGLRLDNMEKSQAALGIVPQNLQKNVGLSRSANQVDAKNVAEASPGFHLMNIQDDAAVINGPNGQITVSVGDIAPGLGKVLKIAKRGRKGIVVGSQRTLTAPWDRVSKVPKITASASSAKGGDAERIVSPKQDLH